MGARPARFLQADLERAMSAAFKVYGREVPVAIDPDGRIVILTSADKPRPANSFD